MNGEASLAQVHAEPSTSHPERASAVSTFRRFLWPGLLTVWVVLRLVLFSAATTWTLPDSAKYLSADVPLRLDGQTASPGWLVLLLYRLMPGDDARVWLQFLVATVAWGTAAWILGSLADRYWQRTGLFAFVLVFGLTLPVVSLDRILQTESLVLSLVVLWVALWLKCLGSASAGLTGWWLALSMFAAVAVRPQVGLLLGPASMLLFTWLLFRSRRVTTTIAVPLVIALLATVWSGVVLARFDRANDHDSARAYFMSWYRGTDPGYRAMEQEYGRPPCPTLDRYTADTETAAMHFAWDYYYSQYRRECPQLVAWHAQSAPDYLTRVLSAPAATLRLLARDLPFLIQPWVRGENPAPLGTFQATVFGITEQRGLVNTDPQPGVQSLLDSPRVASPLTVRGVSTAPIWAALIWIAAAVIIVGVSRARGLRVDRRYAWGVGALLATSAAGVFLSWVGDAWEMDRHSLPWSLLLYLLLGCGVLLGMRAQPAPQMSFAPARRREDAVIWAGVAVLLVVISWIQADQKTLTARPPELPTTEADAAQLRLQLRELFLDNGEKPAMSRIGNLAAAELPAAVASLQKMVSASASFTVDLRNGMFTTGFVMQPVGPPRCALLYNGGHGPWWVESAGFLSEALERKCVVAAVNMPMMEGPVTVLNEAATVNISNGYFNHFGMQLLARPDDNVLDLFVIGPLSVLDWLRTTHPDLPVVVAGFSGGGYVTSITAALDPDIARSLAVAGSTTEPMPRNCTDDYEQCLPEFLNRFTWEQVYFLSAHGGPTLPARVAGQVLNQADPCCHAGVPDPYWVDEVNSALQVLGPDRFAYRLSTRMPPAHRIPPVADRLLGQYIDELTSG